MLYEIYLDAIRNKEQRILKFKDSNQDKIESEALLRWIKYNPLAKQCISAGVDSSWNKRVFQGFDVYVVNAVSVTSDNIVLERKWENNLGVTKSNYLEDKALTMEAIVTDDSADLVDIVSVDGSLISRFVKNRQSTTSQIVNIVKRHNNIVFISKTSDSRAQFRSLNSKAGDIYYFNRIGKSAGYSIPFENKEYLACSSLIEVYARLRDGTPMLKIEICGRTKRRMESDIKELLCMLSYHSVAGYPYCLKLAHKYCKVSNEDVNRLVNIYGFTNEIGSRDVLDE